MIPAGPTKTSNTPQKPHFSGAYTKKCIRNFINTYSWVYTRYRFIKSFLRFTYYSIPQSWELAKIIWLKKRDQ